MSQFKYALNSSTIRPTPILEKIAIAGEASYAGIELWHDDIEAHLAQGGTVADIRKALQDHNVAVPTTIYLKGWFDSKGEEHTRALDDCKRRMGHAAELGAVHVIAGPPLGKANRDIGAWHYRELLELGISCGVEPAMEYLGFVEEINSIEAALEVVSKAGHPAGTIVHDPFHIFRGGGSFESLAKVPGNQIAICHFNDAPKTPARAEQHDKDRVMPGDGHLDLKRMVQLLKQVEYHGWISLELFREDLWASNPRDVARTGLEKMRQVVEG